MKTGKKITSNGKSCFNFNDFEHAFIEGYKKCTSTYDLSFNEGHVKLLFRKWYRLYKNKTL